MENKKIIIVLIVIIVILTAAIGFTMFNPVHSKEPTKINITSKNTLTEGDNLTLQLTDLNKTALSKQKVNITVKNSKGKVVLSKTVKTNSKGKAKLDLDLKKGKYNVTVSYGGNENYTGNNTTQNLTIKEKVVEAQQSSSSSNGGSSEPSDWYDSRGAHHFYENGQEYVGDPNAQHMTIEMSEYVREHGMGD
ncbi:Ig-like domain-containing protein [Methanobrevibacter sp. UBA188]|uniref:Ig-like domain-containing protein n=1 Tax=Methanobrevibacter sp. UBA188 TaxID=1915473 RepID=UPI0025D7CA18|nr:Ig-like domain-containing protein [Methanobrevibacter sp. UBA188]